MATILLYSLIPPLILLLSLPIPTLSQTSFISSSPSSSSSSSSSMPPALSPDIMPVFPSPKQGSPGVVPTIPASPSPPNPDDIEPHSAFAPFGSEPISSAVKGGFVNLVSGVCTVALAAVIMWWL